MLLWHNWTHRALWALNSALVGFIVDRITHFPHYGLIAAVVSAATGYAILALVNGRIRLVSRDRQLIGVVVTAVLAVVFFVGCAVSAWFILIA